MKCPLCGEEHREAIVRREEMADENTGRLFVRRTLTIKGHRVHLDDELIEKPKAA